MTIERHSGEHRTLVVDDHGISGRHAVAALRRCGGVVRRVQTARDALETALSWHPDLICMDFRLPDRSGLEVIRHIRLAWPANRSQPRIVIMTADDSGLEQSDLLALDVNCLLVKPVSGRQLRDAAGLDRHNRVSETNPGGHGPDLKNLFREELQRRLPELDQGISDFDRNRVAGILHQLIASSAMCDEHNLEASMRALDACSRRDDSHADLAQAYYHVLDSARDFLSRVEPFKPPV
jgi:CheY-like chemotaxis protein